jgi:ATP-dependent RNA helicase RhlE
MKFEKYGFNAEIEKNIFAMGFRRPTDIQFKSIPPILKGEDVLAVAQTGTGKTAAFAIPVLHILTENRLKRKAKEIKCLVMVPTRELAEQIAEVFEKLSKNTDLQVIAVYGGVEQDPQIKNLKNGADILIATPGRMFDLVSQGFIVLDYLKILILDEADRMLDKGFIRDIRDLIKFLPKKRQTLFFSATIDKDIKELAYSLVHKPVRIQISPKDPVNKNINHSVAFIKHDDKRFFLERIVKENPESKILVFVRTKVRAERVFKALERVNIKSETLHGDKEQKIRFEVLNRFRNGETKILIATDVSSRGIDIEGVEFVVNYDLPEIAENYVHRVGRTGRGTHRGNAVAFCGDEETELLTEIEEFLGQKIQILEIPRNEYETTIDFSEQAVDDWKTLISEDEKKSDEINKLKRRKKKNKKDK